MNKKDYRFVIPVSQTEWLEVVTRQTNKPGKILEINSLEQVENNSGSAYSEHSVENNISHHPHLPEEMFKALHATHQAIFQIFQNQRTFMVATAHGFQLMDLEQIVCFEYIKERRLWEVTLTDESTLQLKRNTNADDILNYSLKFVRINQQIIINLDFLNKIERNLCRISANVTMADKLTISRNYMKSLLERVEVI